MAFWCVSQQGEFKSAIKNFLGEVHVKSFWPKKLRKKKVFRTNLQKFRCQFFLDYFFVFRVFGVFSKR
jgi:hypothetical protein